MCRGSQADVAFLFFCFFTGQPASDDFHQTVWVMWFQRRSGHLAARSPWLRGTCSRWLNNNTAGTFSLNINKPPALREGKGFLNLMLTQLQARFLAPDSLSGRDWQTSHLTFSHKNSYRPHICPLKNTPIDGSASRIDPRSPQKVHFPSDFVLKRRPKLRSIVFTDNNDLRVNLLLLQTQITLDLF